MPHRYIPAHVHSDTRNGQCSNRPIRKVKIAMELHAIGFTHSVWFKACETIFQIDTKDWELSW